MSAPPNYQPGEPVFVEVPDTRPQSEDHQTCPTCGGSGRVAIAKFKKGDRVAWDTGSWWGKRPATVLSISAKRVRIKTDAHTSFNGGHPWIAYVSPHKLEAYHG